jgi:monoamine oxidase
MKISARRALARSAASLGLALAFAACNPPSESRAVSRDAELERSPLAHGPIRPPPRVVVVGGGLAGLVAAYELQKRGVTAHLLEAGDVFGGRVQTAYYGEGLNAEFGMQEMWQGNPLLDISRELGVEMDPEPEEPFSSVIIDGKLYPYVQKTLKEFFATVFNAAEQKAYDGWMKSAKKLHDEATKQGLKSQKIRELQALSFAAWVQSAKLPKKVADFLKLTLECELATTWDQFSALDGLLEIELFFGQGLPNYHVKGGNTRLIEAIANAIKGPKTTSALVQTIKRSKGVDGRIRIEVSYLKSNRVETVEAERLVLAVPFVRLHQINIEPPISEDRWRAIGSLGFGQYTVVHMLVAKDAEQIWRIHGETPFPVLTDGPLGVIYGVQHDSPSSQPLEVFAFLVYGLQARLFHMVPRDTKVKAMLDEVDRLWPGFSKHVKATHVYTYHPTSLAVWPPGRSPLDEPSELIRTPELGTYLAGDWTWSSHSDGAAKSGINAAKLIAQEIGASPSP